MASHFDELAKALAQGTSRRRVLRGMLGGLFGAIAATVMPSGRTEAVEASGPPASIPAVRQAPVLNQRGPGVRGPGASVTGDPKLNQAPVQINQRPPILNQAPVRINQRPIVLNQRGAHFNQTGAASNPLRPGWNQHGQLRNHQSPTINQRRAWINEHRAVINQRRAGWNQSGGRFNQTWPGFNQRHRPHLNQVKRP